MYLVVVRPRIWASELRCAAHGGVRYCRANQYSEVGCVQKSKLFQMPRPLFPFPFQSGLRRSLHRFHVLHYAQHFPKGAHAADTERVLWPFQKYCIVRSWLRKFCR